jgi:hypothetical protein
VEIRLICSWTLAVALKKSDRNILVAGPFEMLISPNRWTVSMNDTYGDMENFICNWKHISPMDMDHGPNIPTE